MGDSTGRYTTTYDALGRRASVIQPAGHIITHSYDTRSYDSRSLRTGTIALTGGLPGQSHVITLVLQLFLCF